MPSHSFVQCDVFTDRAFGGNPLAVFPDGRGIDDATMQRIAREMNLSETVFVLPPSDPAKALRRLRIFTPVIELPMAGHPVVGTWHVLALRGVVLPPASGTGTVTVQQPSASPPTRSRRASFPSSWPRRRTHATHRRRIRRGDRGRAALVSGG